MPSKKKTFRNGRYVSEKTQKLFEERKAAYAKQTPTLVERKKWNKAITRSCRNDYRDWVSRWTERIEEANNMGDTKEIYRGVKAVSGLKQTFTDTQPTRLENGNLIQNPQELAHVWSNFLAKKFEQTEQEKLRADFEALPQCQDATENLTREEFEKAVKRMKKCKATGTDGVPAEVWQNSSVAKEKLFQFLEQVWNKESVPAELAVGIFVMIFKGKGSSDDCSGYRCIGLLNHAYKILTVILLQRLVEQCEHYFSDWQAGFRQHRGCRDNILLLRIIYEQVIKENSNCVVTFIDFAAAFDSVSHKYIDAALAKAGASRKCRKIFREIYAVATGVARVNGTNGQILFSAKFNVGRGVIQGDIISPILFILALDQLVRTHDVHGNGVNCGALNIRVLGYADDAALVERETEVMTKRLTSLADGAWKDADMQVKMKKTFSQHVGRREKIKIEQDEVVAIQKSYKHACEYCNRKFKTKRAAQIHMTSCVHAYGVTEEYYEVEDVIGVFGRIGNRWYLVKWAGYDIPEWERGRQLEKDGCHEMIRSFWEKSGLSPAKEFFDDESAHRCEVCAKDFKRGQDLKAHQTRMRHHVTTLTKVTKTAQEDARHKKISEMQNSLPKVKWGQKEANNCWEFRYLGAIFEAGGGQMADVRRRINMAVARFGKMRNIWTAKVLHIRLRMRLYISSVCSILTYGSEAWLMTEEIRRAINGANSRMVSIITGNSPHDEAKDGTRSFDLVRAIRARRLAWLGHILRMAPTRILAQAVGHVYKNRSEGDILTDAPKTQSWEELRAWAKDRKKWRTRVHSVRLGSRTTVSLQALFVPEQEFSFTVSS